MKQQQPSLFDNITQAYLGRDEVSNQELYAILASKGVDSSALDKKSPVGKSGSQHSLLKRSIRWQQQTLKQLNLLEKVANKRSIWKLTDGGKKKFSALHEINDGHVVLAFSTTLGLALWANCKTLFSAINEPIALSLSSPPYPLNNPKAYGNVKESVYVDWICEAIEPIVKNLVKGGSIVINVGNDVFLKGLPARSNYRERMVIAFEDRLGLFKMDEIPWINTSKAPGPIFWSSITRQQLNSAWEPVYWFTNDPKKCLSNNRRVLQTHSEKHLQWLKNRSLTETVSERVNSDGAHKVRRDSYANITDGKIPRNIFVRGHRCADQNLYKSNCLKLGIQPHGAPFPLELAKFFIEFLTKVDDLVVDPFAGSFTVAKAAETLGRKWICTDIIWEYLRGSYTRFDNAVMNSEFSFIN